MRLTLVVLAMFCMRSVCAGQTVQLPVVERFSISTTVSVPDRGSIFLGGVKRANSSRKSNGVFRPGSSIGLDRSFSGVSASVYIHDFESMDKFLLGESVPGMSSLYSRSVSPLSAARAAYYAALQKKAAPAAFAPLRRQPAVSIAAQEQPSQEQPSRVPRRLQAPSQHKKPVSAPSAPVSRRHRAALAWLKLADNAAARGESDKARRYYERAKAYGSKVAEKNLDELKPGGSIATLAADRMLAIAAGKASAKSRTAQRPAK